MHYIGGKHLKLVLLVRHIETVAGSSKRVHVLVLTDPPGMTAVHMAQEVAVATEIHASTAWTRCTRSTTLRNSLTQRGAHIVEDLGKETSD